MKKAAQTWYNYCFILLGLSISISSAIVPYFLLNNEKWPINYVTYMMMFVGVCFIGVGFIVQDLYRGFVRRKINDWDNKLEQKYLNKAWAIFFPLLVSGLISFLCGLIIYLFIK